MQTNMHLYRKSILMDVLFLSTPRFPAVGGDAAAGTIESHPTNSIISASLIFIHCTWLIVSIYSTNFHKLELQP